MPYRSTFSIIQTLERLKTHLLNYYYIAIVIVFIIYCPIIIAIIIINPILFSSRYQVWKALPKNKV